MASRSPLEQYRQIEQGLTRPITDTDPHEGVRIRGGLINTTAIGEAVPLRTNLCKKGHELTEANTIRRRDGFRRCRRCFNDAQIRNRRRRKEVT